MRKRIQTEISRPYTGKMSTLTIAIVIALRTVDSANPRAPKFEILALSAARQWVQLGALFELSSNSTGETFLDGKIEDPSLEKPLYISAFRQEDGSYIVWSRPTRRGDAPTHTVAADHGLGESSDEGAFGGEAELANLIKVERLVFVGDKRQLGAIDSGKPFEIMQATGTETAAMPVDLRARSEMVRTATAAVQAGRMGEEFAVLRDRIVEAPGRMAERAAKIWLALPEAERERTMLFVSGRQHKGEVNRLVQQRRLARGELGATVLQLDVLDRVNLTREEHIYVKSMNRARS